MTNEPKFSNLWSVILPCYKQPLTAYVRKQNTLVCLCQPRIWCTTPLPVSPQVPARSICIHVTTRGVSSFVPRLSTRPSQRFALRAECPSASLQVPGSTDLERRLGLIRAWRALDYASVNLSEEGAEEIIKVLIQGGVGVEAGVWTVEDAERLGASGLGHQVTRVLVEPRETQVGNNAADAVKLAGEIHSVLDSLRLTVPRLQHGDGVITWALLTDAVRRGLDTRVGLEDTLHEPSGERTVGNEALVRTACNLGAGTAD